MALIKMDGLKESSAELRTIIPNGTYIMRVTAVEPKKSKTDKDMLKITAEITEGEYADTPFWLNFTLPCAEQDEKANDFCKRAFKRFIVACKLAGEIGEDGSFDDALLHNAQFKGIVTTKNDKEYGERNELSDCLPLE